MTVNINLNDFVKFKLTDKGKDIYYHQYDEINALWGRQIAKPHYQNGCERIYRNAALGFHAFIR